MITGPHNARHDSGHHKRETVGWEPRALTQSCQLRSASRSAGARGVEGRDTEGVRAAGFQAGHNQGKGLTAGWADVLSLQDALSLELCVPASCKIEKQIAPIMDACTHSRE